MKTKRFITAGVLAAALAFVPAVTQAYVLPVTDALALVEHITEVALQKTVKAVQQLQAERLYKMSLRLSQWVSLAGYVIHRDFMPEWRIHCWFDGCGNLFANDYLHALTYGDPTGTGYASVTVPRANPDAVFSSGGYTADALAVLRSMLASIDLIDSAIVRDTHVAGQYRFAGRDEAQAIIELQDMVTDEDLDQSLAAGLDKVAAAELVTLQNKQARAAMEVALLEQLVVEQTLEREADVALNNMVLTQMQAAADEGELFSVTRGATDALTHWHLR